MASLKEDIEEYLGFPYEYIERDFSDLLVDEPTKDELWQYYTSDKYAYFMLRSIVKGESLPSMQQLLSDVIDMDKLADLRILVYGCGEGLIPLTLKKGMGFEDITIADVPHKYLGFIKFISDKYLLNFKFLTIEPRNEYPLEQEYDFIICNDTLGMEWDPAATLRYLAKHLANFGRMYLSSDNSLKGDLYQKIAENIGLKPKHKDDTGFKVFQRSGDKFSGTFRMINFYPAPLKNTYGFLGAGIVTAMERRGYIVNNRNLYPSMESMPYSNISLILSTPYSFLRTNSEKTIGFTMFDATRIPESWVSRCNQMDRIIVPCSANVEAFKNCGVTVPIDLVPAGVDTDLYNPAIFYKGKEDNFYFGDDNLYRGIGKAFKFLVVNSGHDKNNNRMIIDAFNSEFSKEIQNREAYLIMRFYKPWIDGRGIVNIRRFLNDYELSQLIHSCDCMISASSGDAVDMPVLQGMAHEKPVIVSEGFAHSDDVGIDDDGKRGFFIKTKEWIPALYEEVQGTTVIPVDYDADTPRWVLPDFDSLKERMRFVYENGEEATIAGRNARRFVLMNRTREIMAKKIIEILEKV